MSASRFVNNIGLGARYDGTFVNEPFESVGSCDEWNDYTKWSQERKDGLRQVAQAHMNALRVGSIVFIPFTAD